MSAPPLGYVLKGISDELMKRGMVLHFLGMRDFDIRAFAKSDLFSRLDGLMDMPYPHGGVDGRKIYDALLRNKKSVFFTFYDPSPQVNRVNNDERSTMRQIVGHLTEEDHPFIGYVHQNSHRVWSEVRKKAFENAMVENRQPLHKEWIGEPEKIFPRIAEKASSQKKPTALVFDNDKTLFLFQDFARRKKIRIPEDVAIAGVDNDIVEARRHGGVSHTSAAIDFYGIGKAGAVMMANLLTHKIPPTGNHITVQPKLIVRRSSLKRSLVAKGASEETFREMVTAYLEVHGTEDHAGDEIAEHAGMARYYFRKKFTRLFGKTLVEYLSDLRAKKAAILLRSTDKPVTWIMHEVGFSTHQTFTSAFRKRFGMSAQEYRKSP